MNRHARRYPAEAMPASTRRQAPVEPPPPAAPPDPFQHTRWSLLELGARLGFPALRRPPGKLPAEISQGLQGWAAFATGAQPVDIVDILGFCCLRLINGPAPAPSAPAAPRLYGTDGRALG